MKVMLASVGGAEAPVIFSISHHKPDAIIFFASKGSRAMVNKKILPAVLKKTGKIPDHEIIVTDDEQDIGESVRTLLVKVPEAMRNLGYEGHWADIVDYTGGTKTMSSATVWASSKYPCGFSYIGADSQIARNKGGLGIVLDGRELCLIQENPWNNLAYFEINDAASLFNCGQYANSAKLFKEISEKVTDNRAKKVFSVLCEVVEGYSQWDMFNHKDAVRLIGRNFNTLGDIAEKKRDYLPDLHDFSEKVGENFAFLQTIKPNCLSSALIYDLLANALRRAEMEKKYEDATARVYSAIEKSAKIALMENHKIDNSNCRKEELSEKLREEYSAKYANGEGVLKFGIIASFDLLNELNDSLGMRFANIANINSHLTERNYSILGHGMQPIGEPSFRRLFNDALDLLEICQDNLPAFPLLM